jgi:hypothetical protein
MMSADEWKGETLIRVPAKTTAQKRAQSLSLAGKLDHARRRAKGAGMAQAGGYWARRIHASAVHANITRGGDLE